MRIAVRPAQATDLEWLLGQLKAFAQFLGNKRSVFGDEAYCRVALAEMIASHVVLIAEADGIGPVGFIGGQRMGHPFNPTIRVLCETFWWVDPHFRGSRAGLMLLNSFTDIGKESADWITMALEHHSPVAERHLERRGYRLNERAFLLEVS